MAGPSISVIMPVYNSAPWLREAIDSILAQTYTDFELIIINDGSTDETEAIIHAYADSRIKSLLNDKNRGLAFTLNRGIDEAIAPLIARMDGDDIAVPERFEKQFRFLQKQPNVAVLASVVSLIDDKGQHIGYWKEDRNNTSFEQIREFMPSNNCIAHPSIMARTAVMKEFRYRDEQSQAEDYDLWLRMLAAGEIFHKLAEPLLFHRILPASFTRNRQENVFYKLARTKWKFAKDSWKSGVINSFVIRTAIFSFYDAVKGSGKELKKTFRS